MRYTKKLAICLLAGVVATITLQRIVYRTIWEFGNKYVPAPVYAIIGCALMVLIVVIYSVSWQHKEKKGVVDSRQRQAALQDILGSFIGLDLSMFGWQKLFHLQFFTPIGRLDEPFNSFSGEALTWAYFGHSYGFTCVIGIFQIVGAILLLFRQTRLFGAIILLPILLNITLLNIFYGFETGDLLHALILLIALSYLILQHYHRLVSFFFPPAGDTPVYSSARRIVLTAVVIVFPLLLVLSFGSPDRNPQLTGKYQVKELSVNQVRAVATSCQDSTLTTVYFDQDNNIVLEFNGLQRRWIGSYQLDRSTGTLVASWRYPTWAKDTLYARLDRVKPGEWRMMGLKGKDSLQARLVKL